MPTTLDGLGKDWQVNHNSIKPYAAGFVIHPLLDLALDHVKWKELNADLKARRAKGEMVGAGFAMFFLCIDTAHGLGGATWWPLLAVRVAGVSLVAGATLILLAARRAPRARCRSTATKSTATWHCSAATRSTKSGRSISSLPTATNCARRRSGRGCAWWTRRPPNCKPASLRGGPPPAAASGAAATTTAELPQTPHALTFLRPAGRSSPC